MNISQDLVLSSIDILRVLVYNLYNGELKSVDHLIFLPPSNLMLIMGV